MLRETRVFDDRCGRCSKRSESAQGMPWGIVTNKAVALQPNLWCKALGLHRASATLVGGDSTPHTKPHPAPAA